MVVVVVVVLLRDGGGDTGAGSAVPYPISPYSSLSYPTTTPSTVTYHSNFLFLLHCPLQIPTVSSNKPPTAATHCQQ